MSTEHIWLGVGLAGQALFFGRFLVQWIASERKKQSVVPVGFWYFSLGGGIIMLAYAVYRRDPVFIIGQASGLVVYARNLYFIHRLGPVAEATGSGPDAKATDAKMTAPCR
jgi:lipid-A-disaccharide synthase-like uncharacterized protein